MPIYEYQCKKCNAHTEVMQKITDKPLTRCRKCGGRLEKLLSAPAIQFKGSGWYVTDYAGKKAEKSEGKEEKSSATETKASADKATSKDTASSKKASKPKPTSSSGD
ncbi:MAG: zinc ribbon domain-containing protein [Acidobacteriota bacterium]|nr:zinc ribbon domain-containing protein [Acidobacteriota bacterium]